MKSEQLIPLIYKSVMVVLTALLLAVCMRWYQKGREVRKLKIGIKQQSSSSAADMDGDVELPAVPSMQPSGGGGPGLAEVASHLKELKLQKYLAEFERHGYDDWNEILQMGEAKLEQLVTRTRMPANHADRFKDYIFQSLAEN